MWPCPGGEASAPPTNVSINPQCLSYQEKNGAQSRGEEAATEFQEHGSSSSMISLLSHSNN